jgi:hypothetical protein
LVAGILVTGPLGARGARAEPDPRIAKAQAVYAEGLRQADDHHEDAALKKFEEAYAIYPSPNILAAIGREKHLLGRDVEALRDLREAGRDPLLNPANAANIRGQIAELDAMLGHLRIEGPRDTRVVVDDREYTLPLEDPIDVRPGAYRASAKLDGRSTELKGDVGAGATIALRVAFEAPAGTTAAPHVDPPAPERPAERTRWGTGQYVGLGVALAGVAAVAAGAAFFVAKGNSSDQVSQLEQLTAANHDACEAGSTSQPCRDLASKRDERSQNGALGTAFVIGGVVALVAGITTMLVWPKKTELRSGVTVRPLGGGVASDLVLHF